MNNLLEVSSPLWLVVATFALPFILGNFSLSLSNLRNAFPRKKQKSARETATQLPSSLLGRKPLARESMFAGFLILSNLSLSGITLSPPFSPAHLDYTALVDHTVHSTTVTATPNDSEAAVDILWASDIAATVHTASRVPS